MNKGEIVTDWKQDNAEDQHCAKHLRLNSEHGSGVRDGAFNLRSPFPQAATSSCKNLQPDASTLDVSIDKDKSTSGTLSSRRAFKASGSVKDHSPGSKMPQLATAMSPMAFMRKPYSSVPATVAPSHDHRSAADPNLLAAFNEFKAKLPSLQVSHKELSLPESHMVDMKTLGVLQRSGNGHAVHDTCTMQSKFVAESVYDEQSIQGVSLSIFKDLKATISHRMEMHTVALGRAMKERDINAVMTNRSVIQALQAFSKIPSINLNAPDDLKVLVGVLDNITKRSPVIAAELWDPLRSLQAAMVSAGWPAPWDAPTQEEMTKFTAAVRWQRYIIWQQKEQDITD